MRCVWAHPERSAELHDALCRFVSERIWGERRAFGAGTSMGVANGESIVAAVIFTNYDTSAGVVEMNAAADSARWLTRPVLAEMFGYAFDQLGCQAVVLRVHPGNTRLHRILPAYGFERHDVPRLRGRDTPEAFYILGDDVWRANGFHRRK